MLQSNIISNLNKTLRSNFASPLDGSGGGGPVTPWQSLLEDASLIMRLNGDGDRNASVTGAGTVVAGKALGNNNTILPRIGGDTTNISVDAFDGFVADFRAYSRALTVDEALILATGPTP